MRDVRLSPRCKLHLPSVTVLCSVERWFFTDDSGLHVGLISEVQPIWCRYFNGQAVQISWPLKTEQIWCPETSVRNCNSALRKIPKEKKSYDETNWHKLWKVILQENNFKAMHGSCQETYGLTMTPWPIIILPDWHQRSMLQRLLL